MAGRPRGAWKDKAWRDALRIAVLRPNGEEPKPKTKLDAIAIAFVNTAKAGDIPAIKEIGDRLDGKVAQAIVGGDEDDNPIRMITRIERAIVHPKN